MIQWTAGLAGTLILLGMPQAVIANAEQPNVFEVVRFEQRLNEHVPLDAPFRDHTGRPVRLGDYFGTKPVILNLVYFECPMLCTLSMNAMVRGLRPLQLTAGEDFDVLTVSFDPRETSELAAAKRENYLDQYGRPAAQQGWHFLTGERAAIDQLCEAVGFHYVYDEKSKQFAHPSGLVILTPDGRIARYLFELEYAPRDLKLALVEASDGKIGSAVDQILLMCYGYDPAQGKYAFIVMNVLRAAGAITVAMLAGFIGVNTYRERKRRRQRDRKARDNDFERQEPDQHRSNG